MRRRGDRGSGGLDRRRRRRQIDTFAGGPLPDDVEGTFGVTMTLPATPDTTIYFPFVQRCEVGEIRGSASLLNPVTNSTSPRRRWCSPVPSRLAAPRDGPRFDDPSRSSPTSPRRPTTERRPPRRLRRAIGGDHRRGRDLRAGGRRRAPTRRGVPTPARSRSSSRWPPSLVSVRSSPMGSPGPRREPQLRRDAALGCLASVGRRRRRSPSQWSSWPSGCSSAHDRLAHAELLSSFPGNQELLVESPAEIALQFTEGVDPIEPGIRLVDAAGNDVEIGAVSQAAGSERMRAEVPTTLDDGTYVVAWQAVSADSHMCAARSPSRSASPPR